MATKPYVDKDLAEANRMAKEREAAKRETPKPQMSIKESMRDMREEKKQATGEKAMGYKAGGMPSFKKAADGIASKGKTKALRFANGGVTRADGAATKGKTKGTMVKMCNGGMSRGKK